MDGSREKSSGPPPPRAEEIPTAIDEVLNRIKVKDLSFLENMHRKYFAIFRRRERCQG